MSSETNAADNSPAPPDDAIYILINELHHTFTNYIIEYIKNYILKHSLYNVVVQIDFCNQIYSVIIEDPRLTSKSKLVKHIGKYQKIKAEDHIIKNGECCSICYSDYQANEFQRTLPICHHIFHKKCIDTWFYKNIGKMDCPLCRQSYNQVIEIDFALPTDVITLL
jgi:hypothetical protein